MVRHSLISGMFAFRMVCGQINHDVVVPAEYRLKRSLNPGEELVIPKRFARLITLLVAVYPRGETNPFPPAPDQVFAQCGDATFDLSRGVLQLFRGGHCESLMPDGNELRLINRSADDVEFEVVIGFEPLPEIAPAAEAEAATAVDGETAPSKSVRRRREAAATAAN